ncbi:MULTISPECIES: accessory gene regulator ArgB-like protein [Cohnella]|jgi:accessory gene regulator B|uniref:accessory gene regulator ArgB-like protein n=1 Tax=Cohnella TaxID=329857 RepID=UPI00035D6E5C|nr:MULTISPECIES: accessory gene regulator B family protein [Cohnella]REK62113.1 MAG: post-translational modification of quorum-sensing peptide protein [Cohnella sp.]
MIEVLALRLAQRLKNAEPERTASVDVMKYSLIILLNLFFTVLVIGLAGAITGKFGQTMLGLAAFMALKFVSGGAHLRTALQCSVLSVVCMAAAPHIPMTEEWVQGTIIASAVLLLLFAPSNLKGHTRIPERYFPLLKLASVLIVSLNFFWLSSTVAVAQLIQSATTIRIPIRR